MSRSFMFGWFKAASRSRSGTTKSVRCGPGRRPAHFAPRLEALEDRVLPSLTPHLIPGGLTNPTGLVAIGQTCFFAADDGHGRELWKSDGTATGTVLVSSTASDPQLLTNVNGTLFFTAIVSGYDRELWKSDGTPDGTVLVKDIYSGSASPFNLTSVLNPDTGTATLFFTANDGVHGRQLWESDGTEAGTTRLTSGLSFISNLTDVNGTLFFAANDSLWKSDGTAAGTVRVGAVGGIDYTQHFFTNVNGTLFFPANDPTHGRELWKSDGTSAGTVMVKDIYPGSSSSYPENLTNVGGTLFFVADDGDGDGRDLWKSDGTADGTVMVKDNNPGSGSFSPTDLTNVGGVLFFSANDGTNGRELWKSDGTAGGTVMVKDINPGSASSNPDNLTDVGGTVFFTADDGVHGTELWQSDGTADGTVLVADINPGSASSYPFWLTAVNGTLFFTANDGVHGVAPWVVPSVVLGGAPASSPAGTPINLTGTVQPPDASVVYTWSVTKNGSPYITGSGAAFTFTPTEAATYGVTLIVTDGSGGSDTRTATILVTAAAADHLAFLQQPTNASAGQTISPAVTVEVVDQFGNVVTSDDTDTVTLSIGTNPSGGTLSGTLTVTVVNGIATFSDLSIDLTGDGYTLHATVGGGLPDIDSNAFSIT